MLYKIAFSSPPNHICNKVSVLWTTNICASQSSISVPILIQIQNKEISTHNTVLAVVNVLEYRPWLVPRDERPTDLFCTDMACNYIINYTRTTCKDAIKILGIVRCIQSKEPYDERSYIQAQTLYSTYFQQQYTLLQVLTMLAGGTND